MPGTATMRRGRWATVSPYALAGLLGVTGSLHFIVPKAYVQIVPSQLPAPYALVYASGVAELLCAAGLAMPRTRRLAGWATVALFVAVFPANVQMVNVRRRRDASGLAVGLSLLRLPVQVPLVAWAVSIARANSPAHHRPA